MTKSKKHHKSVSRRYPRRTTDLRTDASPERVARVPTKRQDSPPPEMTEKGYSTLFTLDAASLKNEAQVETRFVAPLLRELGYPAEAILPKESVPGLRGHEGSRMTWLKVDFILNDPAGAPSIIVEAKAPTENIQDHWGQAASYALSYNSENISGRGIELLLITNGLMTALYPHDRKTPLVTLRLEDCSSGSPPLVTLKTYANFKSRTPPSKNSNNFQAITPAALNTLFDQCHDLIWKKQKLSPTDAFYEFCKFIFIKLREDKKRQNLDPSVSRRDIPLTSEWLGANALTSSHPVRDILFAALRDDLEADIRRGKKRIFRPGETFDLDASTCSELVRRFEAVNLSAVDEDLNGRMFERFLNQEIRGRELGQYFTPRTVVDFMARIALNECDITSPPKIIDACVGTAGFLIEAMAYLIAATRNDRRFTNTQREKKIIDICNNHLFGVEANERICRIARINMYLHGDGGSHIFHGDGLDNEPVITHDMAQEKKDEVTELGNEVRNGDFDLVLSNPPFSSVYDPKNEEEKRILMQCDMESVQKKKSNVLFLDRYYRLLKPGGQLLMVIDDTVLNGISERQVREWILDRFVILGIHSLPFNAFFKAKANIKTSIVHLRKKSDSDEAQGHVFMSISNNVGHDNHCKDTPDRNNLTDILMSYFQWKRTGSMDSRLEENQDKTETLECPQQVWIESPDRIDAHRLDAFWYSLDIAVCREEMENRSQTGEIAMVKGNLVQEVEPITQQKRAEMKESGKVFRYIEIGDVTPYGLIISHIERTMDDLPSRARIHICKGDVLVAMNISSRGTVVLVPEEYDGALCTTGFRVIRPDSEEHGKILWYALRSELARRQNYYLCQTASQPELKDETWRNEFVIPMPLGELREKALDEANRIMGHISALSEANTVMFK